MQKVINATFDGKVLHPENPIKIEPNTRVRLTIEPFEKTDKKKERKLGILDGKVTITFADDFKMTEEEFLGLR